DPRRRPPRGSGRDRLARVGQDGDHVVAHLGEAARDLIAADAAVLLVGQHAWLQGGHERRVIGQDADLAVGARRGHLTYLAVEELLLRRVDAQPQRIRHYAASFRAFSMASSMVPTM